MSLSHIQSLRLAAVLEDCLDQLDILGHSLTVQISREQGTAGGQERTRLTKLRRDCQHIWQHVFKLHLELEEKQSFSCLLQVVEEVEQKKKAEKMQREAKRELKQREQNILRQQEEIQQKTEKLEDLKEVARELTRKVNQQSAQIAHRKMILEKNSELQLQLTQKESSQSEKQLGDQLELLQKQLKEEVRVHEESHKFLQNQHEELQQQLQQWQQRTKQMLQEKEQQLNSVRCKRTVNLDKLSDMRRKFREMEQVVMEDREEQEKLRQQQALARSAN